MQRTGSLLLSVSPTQALFFSPQDLKIGRTDNGMKLSKKLPVVKTLSKPQKCYILGGTLAGSINCGSVSRFLSRGNDTARNQWWKRWESEPSGTNPKWAEMGEGAREAALPLGGRPGTGSQLLPYARIFP